MKILQVVEQAFRTLVEEQDDTILWLTQSMRGAGADLEVLLAGNGVSYAVLKNRQPALTIGTWQQSEPADLPRDIASLLDKNVPIHVVREDLAERGLANVAVHPGIQVISRQDLPALYERVDHIWQW